MFSEVVPTDTQKDGELGIVRDIWVRKMLICLRLDVHGNTLLSIIVELKPSTHAVNIQSLLTEIVISQF